MSASFKTKTKTFTFLLHSLLLKVLIAHESISPALNSAEGSNKLRNKPSTLVQHEAGLWRNYLY